MTPAPLLIVMRLANMKVVHPEQVIVRCERCRHKVGVYPSGQRLIAQHPDIAIVCSVCHSPGPNAMLAPGAEREPFESHRRKR